MKFREFLEANLDDMKSKLDCIKVFDVEYMQGVQIITTPNTQLSAVLNDRPVQKYLDFEVENVNGKEREIFVAVKAPANTPLQYS